MKLSLKDLYLLVAFTIVFSYLALKSYDTIARLRNCFPGLWKVHLPPTCCKFDSTRSSSSYEYEPMVVRITKPIGNSHPPVRNLGDCTGELEVKVLTDDGLLLTHNVCRHLPVCEKTAKRLFEIFAQIRHSLGLDPTSKRKIDFHRLKRGQGARFVPNRYIITCGDKVVCISVKGWVFPLACMFQNLAGKANPALNLTWGFCSFRVVPIDKGYHIDPSHHFTISMNILAQSNVHIIEIDRSKFFFNKPDASVPEGAVRIFKNVPRVPFDEETMLLTLRKPESRLHVWYLALMSLSHALVGLSVVMAWAGIAYTICRGRMGPLSSVNPLFGLLAVMSAGASIYVMRGFIL